ncbi:hypothetical protein DL96DRAFT_1612314 [Flagelloscypha sp. PMI_526]|nr:hypothetical protein DL96DRAFT_1612314 [Flagelloscypha sp. PMI_526]
MELEARAGVPASQILGFNKANGLNQAAQKGANAPLTSLANLAKTAITTLLSPGPKLGRSELEELEARAGVPASQILSFNKANGLNQAAQKGANAPLTSLANLAKTAITTLLSPGPKLGRSELEEIHSILSRGLEEMELEARAGVPASQILGFNKANGLNQAAQKGANAPLTSLANLAKTAITTLLSPGPKLGRAELEEVQDMLRRGMEAAVNELD